MATIIGKDPSLPNYARPEFIAVAPDLKLMEDELGGTRAMHAAARRYIRKWTAEADSNYKIRALCETFFEGLGRTLSAAIGMLFARPPAIEWNKSEAAISPDWDNIDSAGTAGHVFVKRFAEQALRDGLAALLVDHPQAPKDVVVTAANEQALNLRPTWAAYSRSSIINWYSDTINNTKTLTLAVLHEPSQQRSGAFGVETRQRFRVLRLETVRAFSERNQLPQDGETQNVADMPMVATWELIEMQNQGAQAADFVRLGFGMFTNREGEVADRIPLRIAYTGRTDGIMDAKIPLLGVAWANLSHWQLSTDLRFNTSVAAFAQPCVVGNLVADALTGTQPKLQIGPLVTVQVQQGGDFKWVEPAGTGLKALAEMVLEKLRDIAVQGVSFMQRDTRAAETAEAKRLDASAENSTLATAAQGIEDAVNAAFETHAWYRGIQKADAPVLTLSREYEDTTLGADIMTAYINGVKDAGLPVRLLLEAWQQGGRIKADEDLDALEMEIMANQQAIADAQAEADAAQAEAMGKGPRLA